MVGAFFLGLVGLDPSAFPVSMSPDGVLLDAAFRALSLRGSGFFFLVDGDDEGGCLLSLLVLVVAGVEALFPDRGLLVAVLDGAAALLEARLGLGVGVVFCTEGLVAARRGLDGGVCDVRGAVAPRDKLVRCL